MHTPRRLALAVALAASLGLATPALATAHNAIPDAAAAPNFSGTVALDNCSGSIVRWKTSKDTDKAMVLSNGHCYDFHGRPARRSPTSRTFEASTCSTPTALWPGPSRTVTLLYATMWKTDVSLYQLDQTYQDLQDQYGVPAITIASTRPSPNDQPIEVLSGFWKIAYDCNLNGFAYRLLENGWTWNNSLRYSDGGCQVIGGTSGSPVLDANRNEIGINNTINEDGERCTFDNPCEENRKGKITVHLHRGYGQQTWVFYTCLNGTTLDLAKKGCQLPKP